MKFWVGRWVTDACANKEILGNTVYSLLTVWNSVLIWAEKIRFIVECFCWTDLSSLVAKTTALKSNNILKKTSRIVCSSENT